jgi:hypothetical protein
MSVLSLAVFDLAGVVLSMCNGPCVGSQGGYLQRLDPLTTAGVRPFVWVLFVFLALAEHVVVMASSPNDACLPPRLGDSTARRCLS